MCLKEQISFFLTRQTVVFGGHVNRGRFNQGRCNQGRFNQGPGPHNGGLCNRGNDKLRP